MRVADYIVGFLQTQKTPRLYCVPGESYLTLLDGLYDSKDVQTIICRHESGAGFMAVTEAKITGRPGVFAVSRGPGATNGSIALHVAEQDAVPVICLIGQVSRKEKGRGAFQEMDYSSVFGSVAKAVFEPYRAEEVAKVFSDAWKIALDGIPGPVVISLPEDLLADELVADCQYIKAAGAPDARTEDVEQFLQMLGKAERPLIIAGNAMRSDRRKQALARFAKQFAVPVACAWKAQDVFDNNSSLFAGHIGFGAPLVQQQALGRADLIIGIGTRMGDVASMHYSLPRAPVPDQPFIHIYDSAEPIGRNVETALGVCADPGNFLDAVCDKENACKADETWIAEIHDFVAGFMAFKSPEPDDGVDYGKVIIELARQAPDDAIVVTDAGNFSSWVHRHWRMGNNNLMLGAIAGAMGFGVPGGVAASLAEPDRCVIVVVGDGGMLMTGQELATAVQYGARPKIILSDNSIYGTIRTHQEKHFSGRVSGTNLTSPDFRQWAQSFGAKAVAIRQGDDIAARLAEALAHEGPSVVHVHSSREALSAFTTLSRLQNL